MLPSFFESVLQLIVRTSTDLPPDVRAAMKHADSERLQCCTNCGLAPLPRGVAEGKLAALGAGARLLRAE